MVQDTILPVYTKSEDVHLHIMYMFIVYVHTHTYAQTPGGRKRGDDARGVSRADRSRGRGQGR
jgi:hypothetical protein